MQVIDFTLCKSEKLHVLEYPFICPSAQLASLQYCFFSPGSQEAMKTLFITI